MENYSDFVKSTGYGTGGGLAGWNCRHNFIPFNPETMANNLKQYGLKENEEMYLNHQKQRYFERNIRKYKSITQTEKAALNEDLDPIAKSKIENNNRRHKLLLKKWRKNYINFSKENGLRTQTDRTKTSR